MDSKAARNSPPPKNNEHYLEQASTSLTRHCERSEAIQGYRQDALDCFATLAMTGGAIYRNRPVSIHRSSGFSGVIQMIPVTR